MTPRNEHDPKAAPRGRGRRDDGAALLEFALVAVLLFTLIFGIINFGYVLSFKQDMTRAAAEGARAGAVAFPGSGALAAAQAATKEAVHGSGKNCSTTDGLDSDGDGMKCNVSINTCPVPAGSCVQAVTVILTYDQQHKPLLGPAPVVSLLLPKTMTSQSVARVNT